MRPENGLVIRYSFLWMREFDRGEESGRKGRPVCVQVLLLPSAGKPQPVVLLPITSQPPTKDDDALLIPQLELRRVGLREPAWLIVNHLNFEADFAVSPWLEDRDPIGTFSAAFTENICAAMRKAIRAKRMRSVARAGLDFQR